MLKTLSLVLPVLLPSWRFFQTVEPSPRVQWARAGAEPNDWQTYRPPPQHLSLLTMLWRLFWNPRGNETLFVASCAERLHLTQSPHALAQIRSRVRRQVAQEGDVPAGVPVRFRLVFVQRVDGALIEDVVFVSDLFAAQGQAC